MAKPKLGKMIDDLYAARAARLEYQREVEAEVEKLKEVEAKLEEKILQTFDKSEIEGAKGSAATASVTRLVVPAVKDWPEVFKWIAENNAWDLMEKRMARVAFRDRTEAGQAIPGVESFVKVSLSLNKINKKGD